MPLDTFIAGRYSKTYNAVDVGITDDGIRLSVESKLEMIASSDAYGDSAIDGVYRGGDVFLTYTSKAYKAGSITPFWPWAALGQMSTAAAPIGRLATDVAKVSVLTATANTPAATSPATLTADKTILAMGGAELLYHSKLRQVPIRLQCYPYLSSSNVVWFTTT